MSTHNDCGEDVTWAHREDDTERWLPPLEFAGEVFILQQVPGLDKPVASRMHAYRLHRCDPDKIEAWIAYQERLQALKQQHPEMIVTDTPAYVIARQRRAEQEREYAEQIDCKRCGAMPNQPCRSLSKNPSQMNKPTTWPHPERVAAAEEAGLAR
jgi:hypothetical protein